MWRTLVNSSKSVVHKLYFCSKSTFFRNVSTRANTNTFTTGSSGCSGTGNPVSTALRDPVRQVFISQSNDIFTNLALEDWLYRQHDFAHKHLLLLWRNQPCVVIGES